MQFDRTKPVGKWQLKTTHQDGSMKGRTDEPMVVFEPDQIFIFLTPGPGTGTWQSDDSTTISYGFTQIINYDARGTFTHYVIVTQQGTLSADGTSFTSSGQGVLYDADGTYITTHHTTVQATRVS